MTLPADITMAVIKAAGSELAAQMAQSNADLELFTMQQVADRLKVSKGTAIRLISEVVELGEASKRVSAEQLRRLIASRTIPA